MEGTLKNISTILILATFAFLGYYLYSQNGSNLLADPGADISATLFADVKKYEERRVILNQVSLNTEIFSDERFSSLKGYSRDYELKREGRENPFDVVPRDIYQSNL